MAFEKKAQPRQASMKIGFYGPTGSGKTFTALLLAEGLGAWTKKRVAMVDTEFGADFYAQEVKERRFHPQAFDFDVEHTRSVTELARFVRELDPAKHGVFIMDSVTHFWESAQNAYDGPRNKIGQPPISAWRGIKRPYKAIEHALLNSPLHVIWCGRQANEFETDPETDEMKRVGFKMRAEGETPYEPHILVRMEQRRNKRTGEFEPWAIIEKDRTGVLHGLEIRNPAFEHFAPILRYLGQSQAQLDRDEDTTVADIEALRAEEDEKRKRSLAILERFRGELAGAMTLEEVDAVSARVTPALKRDMLRTDQAELRQEFARKRERLTGGDGPAFVPEESQ